MKTNVEKVNVPTWNGGPNIACTGQGKTLTDYKLKS